MVYVIKECNTNNNDDCTLIGTIYFDEDKVVTENVDAKNPFKQDEKSEGCDVVVYGGEGTFPHIHIIRANVSDKQKTNQSKKFADVCICLHDAKYFDHDKDTSGEFKRKQMIRFDQWMADECSNEPGVTHWQKCVRIWFGKNKETPKTLYPVAKPDYTRISSIHLKE